jgi:hypothetical protein
MSIPWEYDDENLDNETFDAMFDRWWAAFGKDENLRWTLGSCSYSLPPKNNPRLPAGLGEYYIYNSAKSPIYRCKCPCHDTHFGAHLLPEVPLNGVLSSDPIEAVLACQTCWDTTHSKALGLV